GSLESTHFRQSPSRQTTCSRDNVAWRRARDRRSSQLRPVMFEQTLGLLGRVNVTRDNTESGTDFDSPSLKVPLTPTLDSSQPSTSPTGVVSEPTTTVAASGLEASSGPDTSSFEHPSDDVAGQQNVVHEVLKGLDVSFGYHVAGLEKEAQRYAQTWADRGLPRHDLALDEPLEVEKELAHRARQIY